MQHRTLRRLSLVLCTWALTFPTVGLMWTMEMPHTWQEEPGCASFGHSLCPWYPVSIQSSVSGINHDRARCLHVVTTQEPLAVIVSMVRKSYSLQIKRPALTVFLPSSHSRKGMSCDQVKAPESREDCCNHPV